MSETFKEFLKDCLENTYSGDVEVVEGVFEELGEWALNKVIPWLNVLYAASPKQHRFNFDAIEEYLKDAAYQSDEIGLAEYLKEFWDIAIATIGKEEVKKILKEAQTKKEG